LIEFDNFKKKTRKNKNNSIKMDKEQLKQIHSTLHQLTQQLEKLLLESPSNPHSQSENNIAEQCHHSENNVAEQCHHSVMIPSQLQNNSSQSENIFQPVNVPQSKINQVIKELNEQRQKQIAEYEIILNKFNELRAKGVRYKRYPITDDEKLFVILYKKLWQDKAKGSNSILKSHPIGTNRKLDIKSLCNDIATQC